MPGLIIDAPGRHPLYKVPRTIILEGSSPDLRDIGNPVEESCAAIVVHETERKPLFLILGRQADVGGRIFLGIVGQPARHVLAVEGVGVGHEQSVEGAVQRIWREAHAARLANPMTSR